MSFSVGPAQPHDADVWRELREALWPDAEEGEHREEIEQYFAGTFPRGPWLTLMARDEDGRGIGFAEVSERPYAHGCVSVPVGYLEGWYVDASRRRLGVGRALVEAAEQWARGRGCREFASDAEPDNHISAAAHGALGFEDVGLVRCFRKEL